MFICIAVVASVLFSSLWIKPWFCKLYCGNNYRTLASCLGKMVCIRVRHYCCYYRVDIDAQNQSHWIGLRTIRNFMVASLPYVKNTLLLFRGSLHILSLHKYVHAPSSGLRCNSSLWYNLHPTKVKLVCNVRARVCNHPTGRSFSPYTNEWICIQQGL